MEHSSSVRLASSSSGPSGVHHDIDNDEAPELETHRQNSPDPTNEHETKTTNRSLNQTAKTRGSGWRKLEKAMRALHIGAGAIPQIQSAVGGLVSCLDQFEVARKVQDEYDKVFSELTEMADYLNQHLNDPRSQGLTGRITDIARTIDMEIQEVRKFQEMSKTEQVLRAADREEDLVHRFRRVEELFRRIQMETSMSAWSIAQENAVDTRIDELNPARLARYNSIISDSTGRRACTQDTRLDTLGEIEKWSDNPNAPMIYWMDGMAGTGKTTIAYTLAQRLEPSHRLGASFFCTVTSEECRKAGRIIPTIAYQLSQKSTPFKAALGEILKDDPDAPVLTIPEQMKRLLVNPLNQVKDKIARNMVVIIDALDECDDSNIVGLILSSVISAGSARQTPLKFLITSISKKIPS